MIGNVNKFYEKAEVAEQTVLDLYSLKSAPVNELWNKYRALPSNAMYLVASHHTTTLWGIKTKWQMFEKTDKVFKGLHANPNDVQKIMVSIDHAIIDQKRIASLKILFAVLNDAGKQVSEQVDAYGAIEKEDKQLFEQIKYCIWTVHGKPENLGLDFGGTIIQNQPNASLQNRAIRGMIKVLSDGYSDCKKHADLVLIFGS